MFVSDSKYAIDGLTKNFEKLEDEGFLNASNGPIIRATAARIRRRKARTSVHWVKGHSWIAVNEGADNLAGKGCRKPTEDVVDTHIPPDLLLPGAKLKIMTQSLAYKIIHKRKMETLTYQEALDRPATVRNMGLAKGATIDPDGNAPPDAKVWNAIKHKDIPRNIRFFL